MKKMLIAAIILMAQAPSAHTFNYIYLEGKGVGGKMTCSDWSRANHGERAAMTQWVFGFITGYDVAIRPDPSEGGLSGQAIADLVVRLCKEHPDGDLITVAKSIAEYLQKEIKGEVDHPIILKKAARTDPDEWVIVKDLTTNSCAVLGTKSSDKNLFNVATFKAYMTGGKNIKDMVAAQCGCKLNDCSWELPR